MRSRTFNNAALGPGCGLIGSPIQMNAQFSSTRPEALDGPMNAELISSIVVTSMSQKYSL